MQGHCKKPAGLLKVGIVKDVFAGPLAARMNISAESQDKWIASILI